MQTNRFNTKSQASNVGWAANDQAARRKAETEQLAQQAGVAMKRSLERQTDSQANQPATSTDNIASNTPPTYFPRTTDYTPPTYFPRSNQPSVDSEYDAKIASLIDTVNELTGQVQRLNQEVDALEAQLQEEDNSSANLQTIRDKADAALATLQPMLKEKDFEKLSEKVNKQLTRLAEDPDADAIVAQIDAFLATVPAEGELKGREAKEMSKGLLDALKPPKEESKHDKCGAKHDTPGPKGRPA